MRRSTFLLASLMGLAVTACSTVLSVMPVGDEPVYLEPKEWEGLWVRNTGDKVKRATMNVVDAAGGILEYSDPEDCARGILEYSDPEDCTKAVRVVVRQHTYEGERAKFIGQLEEHAWGYVWGKYQRVGNALIIWPPVLGKFQKLIETGEISGQSVDDNLLLIDPLSKDQLDRVSIDKGHELFNYEFRGAKGEPFPNTVWIRVSAVQADEVKRCTSQPNPGEGASESATTTGMPALRYSISDVGPIYRANSLSINNGGQVVASSLHEEDDHVLIEPFLWTRSSGMTKLNALGGRSIDPAAINNIGQLAGEATFGPSPDARYHAMILDPGHGITDLGTLGGESSWALALNDLGQIVGQSETANGQIDAFFWEGGVMSDLGTLDFSSAQAINNSGQVVGSIFTSTGGNEGTYKAFLRTRGGGMTDLGTLGGIDSKASAINEKGEVVGASKTVQGYYRAFIWHPETGMVDLGTLGGRDSAATAINNAGQVVGWSEITWGNSLGEHAFLWDHGTMIDLSSLAEVKAAGWSELTAKGINDQGQVVGVGVFRDGKVHAFLLTPEPPRANGG